MMERTARAAVRKPATHASFENNTLLLVPGWQDSGPTHWQSYWERQLSDARRVRQKEWLEPRLEDWLDGLSESLDACPRPPIVVAHSLGCILVAHWIALHPGMSSKIRAALLVAPADVESEARAPREIRGFGPIPRVPLPIPTIVVASRNDPYMLFDRAHLLARRWHARLVDLGYSGHINADSNLGSWSDGLCFVAQLDTLARAKSSRGTDARSLSTTAPASGDGAVCNTSRTGFDSRGGLHPNTTSEKGYVHEPPPR